MDKGLATYARRFFSGTLLSRVSGLGRDLAMAFAFGDTPSVAAFMVAFRLSNLFRRLLGEGPLQSAFIPHFEGLRSKGDAHAVFFFRRLALLIAAIAIILTCMAEGVLGAAYFFGGFSAENREIIILTAWLFPGLLFICLYGLNISLLNCYDSFFLPSFAPFICNGIWIVAALFLRHYEPSFAMTSLAQWVVVGFFAQWLLTLPLTIRFAKGSLKDWLIINIHPEVKKLFKSFSLGAIGVGAVQINAMADAFFARYADVRGPTYLWYSIRLEQLALAIFGIACVTTIAPRLSRAIKEGNKSIAQNLFALGYQRILSIMVPCTFAIGALGLAAVNLIYGRGNFSENAVLKTHACLFAYGLGLVPATLIMLLSAVHYARDNFRTPMFISIFAVVMNLILNYIFVFVLQFGAVSTALSTSLSAWMNFWVLYSCTNQLGIDSQYSLWRLLNVVLASAFAFLCTLLTSYLGFGIDLGLLGYMQKLPAGFLAQLTYFLILLFSFCVGFFGFAFLSRNRDILGLFMQHRAGEITENN